MTKIECYTENCEHNICSKCTAGMVSFDEKGNCLSKEKRAGGILAQSFADIEAGSDYAAIDFASDIKCENDHCAYNTYCACCNEYIKVDDGIIKTCCVTKKKKK